MPDKIHTLIVDPETATIDRVKEICSTIDGIAVDGHARSEEMLMAKFKRFDVDLLILDINVQLGGIAIIDKIRQINPYINLVLMYDPIKIDSEIIIQALEKGALECMPKPSDPASSQYKEFRLHLLTLTGLLKSRKRRSKKEQPEFRNRFFMPLKSPLKVAFPALSVSMVDVIVMAASTGGPEILSRIFTLLPGDLRVPILLVQHMPKDVSQYFAKSLNQYSELEILEAKEGQEIKPSRVYVAPGGSHMVLTKKDANGKRYIRLNKKALVNGVRPSADVLFKSVAKSYEGNILAVILTGMGKDGRSGVREMKKKGCICFSQKAETCTVYGMPRAVDEADLTDESLDPLSITQKIVMAVK